MLKNNLLKLPPTRTTNPRKEAQMMRPIPPKSKLPKNYHQKYLKMIQRKQNIPRITTRSIDRGG